MFSVGLFYISLGTLLGILGFRWLENQELGDGARYFSRLRAWVDARSLHARDATLSFLAPARLKDFLQHAWTVTQHYVARALAYVGHVIEHRARHMAHRTAKRVRERSHYLASEAVTESDEATSQTKEL